MYSTEHYEINLPRKVPTEIVEMEEVERYERIRRGVNPIVMANLFRCQVELMHRHIPSTLKSGIESFELPNKETAEPKNFISEKVNEVTAKLAAFAINLKTSAQETEFELEQKVKPYLEKWDQKSMDFATSVNQKVGGAIQSIDETKTEWDQKSMDFAASVNQKLDEAISNIDETRKEYNKKSIEVKTALSESVEEIVEKSADFSVSTNMLADDIKDKFHMSGDPSTVAAEEKERTRRMLEKVDPLIEGKKHRMEDQLLMEVKLVN